jgi:hypothetical protein
MSLIKNIKSKSEYCTFKFIQIQYREAKNLEQIVQNGVQNGKNCQKYRITTHLNRDEILKI